MTGRARLTLVALGVVVLCAASFGWCAHPVCVPLDDAAVAEAAKYAPLETRADSQWHGPVWQKRGGRWHQCKSWISRQFFF